MLSRNNTTETAESGLPPAAPEDHRDDAAAGANAISLRAVLRRLILICILPLVMLAAYLAYLHLRHVYVDSQEPPKAAIQYVTTTLDKNLKARIDSLEVLAVSPLDAKRENLPAFYEQAKEFQQRLGGQVLLVDPDMHLLFNTSLGLDDPRLKQSKPDGAETAPIAFASAKPSVSELFIGPLSGKPMIAIAVPVIHEGDIQAVLINTMEIGWLQGLLDEMTLPPDWNIRVYDGNHALLASRGRAGKEGAMAVSMSGEQWEDGSNFSRWNVVIDIPGASYFQPLLATSITVIGLILLSTLLSIVLGQLTARRLSRAMASLGSAAGKFDPTVQRIREIEAVRQELKDEHDSRLAVEVALRESDSRWRFAIEGSGDGMWDWELSSGKIHFSARWKELLGYARDEIGDDFSEWEKRIHPEDALPLAAAISAHFEGRSPEFSAEYRVACKDGDWKWVLARGLVFSRDANGRVLRMIGTSSDISSRKATEAKIEYLAFYDQLTGLPNRRLLMDRMSHALAASQRSGQFGALIFIDLDEFKILNDTWGHATGDEMLKQMAERLSDCMRAGDTVARQGGDEFVIVIENLGLRREAASLQAASICEKLQSAMREIFYLKEHEYRGSASIGLTLFGHEPVAADVLMAQADSAMYLAKAEGRDTFRFFDGDLQAALSARAAFEADLRLSVVRNELHLAYQPQVLSDGTIAGAEALVRWMHPVRGPVSPAEFIPAAEKGTIIFELGRWVLQEACLTLKTWANDPRCAHLTLSVNVSARQFTQPDFVSQVIKMLQANGVDPSRLKLELTESIFAGDLANIADKMAQLKQYGLSFSLDDFGIGYSSLSYIKRLPFDQIKIDQTFVRDVLEDPNDAAIVRTVVALCKSLGLSVIAEGVESPEQKAFLEANDCFAFQGYFFSPPLTIDGFEQYMQRAAQGSRRA